MSMTEKENGRNERKMERREERKRLEEKREGVCHAG